MFKIFIQLFITIVLVSHATPLLKTGQTVSYASDGTEVADGSVKDDGFYQTGVARSYSRSSDVVTDNITGLEWQDDLNASTMTRPWVTSDNYSAANYNDTSGETATTYCSDLTLDGGGWRLPNIEELETIIDAGQAQPSLSEEVFTNYSLSSYWSSTTATTAFRAWSVNFKYGTSNYIYKNNTNNVRCVRGEQLDNSNFSRNATTEIVSDTATNLQWQDNSDAATINTVWQGAIDYCEVLPLDGGGWRLPNRFELLSITDRSRKLPAINDIFSNTISADGYWSSTTSAATTYYAWYVYSNYGYSDRYYKTHSYYVRCVRGGQEEQPTAVLAPIIMYLLD